MRLVCHMTTADIAAIETGKPFVVAASGVDGITVHFDPAVEKPKAMMPAMMPNIPPPLGMGDVCKGHGMEEKGEKKRDKESKE